MSKSSFDKQIIEHLKTTVKGFNHRFEDYDDFYKILIEILEKYRDNFYGKNYIINYDVSIDRNVEVKTAFSIAHKDINPDWENSSSYRNSGNEFPYAKNKILIKFFNNGTAIKNNYFNAELNDLFNYLNVVTEAYFLDKELTNKKEEKIIKKVSKI